MHADQAPVTEKGKTGQNRGIFELGAASVLFNSCADQYNKPTKAAQREPGVESPARSLPWKAAKICRIGF